MPGMNLTRDEAAGRAALIDVDSYAVELDLTSSETTFRSTTVVRFGCREPGSSTFADLVAPTAHEITLNGRALDPASVFDNVRIQLDDLATENELRVVADCAYMNTGEGMHRFVDPVDKSVYLYTQFEVADARRVYACFDQPDLKGRWQLTVIAPADWEVVSNSPTPTPQPTAPGTAVWAFRPTPRLSTYITALVAGAYHVERDEHWFGDRVIPLAAYCRRSLAEHLKSADIFEVTKQGFDYFHETFGYPYPFEKYDQLFVPEYNSGAMENAGCVTILEDYVFRSKVTDAAYERRAETILHELAHMWFGDLVTMRWWDDLWLNESFATYVSVLCQSRVTRWPGAWTTFANVEKAWAYRQDQLPSTHPIMADIRDLDDVLVNFDGITYAKGASVLKQLVAWVGVDHFFAGMRRYFQRYEWGNTTLADLLAILEETSGRDLSAWAKQWLEAAGVNTLRPEFTVDADGRFTSFAIVQEAPAEWPTLRSHRIAIGLYDRDGVKSPGGPAGTADGGIARRDRLELDISGPRTEVADLVGVVKPDLILLNDDDLTYAKIRLDPQSLAVVTQTIGSISESLPRALCWAAAWDMTRDSEMPAREWLRLVLAGIGEESDIAVVQSLIRQTFGALDQFADPVWRPVGLAQLATAARQHLAAAQPGSDHQLAWGRAFVSAARSPEDLAFVRALLDGTDVVDGLTMDADLRWHLLTRLVETGAADEREVDAELHRDNTATGQRHAAGALAARPTPAAKVEAWESVVSRGDLPNAIQASVIGRFASADQLDLTEPFVESYFTSIKDIWANRTNEIAQQIVVGLYPALRIDESTLERTDRFLAEENPVPALRRLLIEGRDGVARALRARACDAAAGAPPSVA